MKNILVMLTLWLEIASHPCNSVALPRSP